MRILWNQLLLELSLDLFNTLQICYRDIEDVHEEVWCWKLVFSSPEQSSRRAIVLPPASALALALVFAFAFVLASTNVIFRTSLFPNPLMDLVYIWYNDRYWSKILFSTIPTRMHDLKVKVTDLELLC